MSHLPTTTAGVRYVDQLSFDDEAPGVQIWMLAVKVDGPSPDIITEIRFPGAATNLEKQALERQIVNAHLAAYEPGVSLTNAKIQVSGRPV